jgi:hypothetical protein
MFTSVYTDLNTFNFSRTALCAVASPISFSCANLRNDFYGLRSRESEMSINFLSLSLDRLPLRSASNNEPVPRNFSVSLRTALRWDTGVSGKFSANCSNTKSVYLLPSRKTYQQEKHERRINKKNTKHVSTRKTRSSIERTTVSKRLIKHWTCTRNSTINVRSICCFIYRKSQCFLFIIFHFPYLHL